MIAWIVSSSALILAVLALRAALRGRISLRLQYALWLLVLVRLLVPVNFGASSLSIMNALPQQRQTVGAVSGKQDGGTEAVSPPAAVSGRDPAAAPAASDTVPNRRQDSVPAAPAAAASGSGRRAVDWGSVAKAVWLTGAAMVGAVFLAANVRLCGRLRRSRRKLEQSSSALPVYESCAVETPCLFGLIRPAIYVTPETLADGEALRYSLTHEQTHCRHGDHLWALLRGVCLALHWYNPLVWWAAERSRRDAELACDEAVIRRLGEGERAAYGRTLVRMTCESRSASLAAAARMTDRDKGLRERIALLAKKPRTTACAALVLLAAILLSTACTFTGGRDGGGARPASSAGAGSQTNKATEALLADARLYIPPSEMEPDTVSADTMGAILCDETMPDGTQIVCYWEPGSTYVKYWAIRRGDTLLRFCAEESAYGGNNSAEPFSGVLGQSGFRILAPRGAGYFAYDYYVLDSAGVPRLLAGCANRVEEADFNGDGETDLRWYYHGEAEVYTYFRYEGNLYLSDCLPAEAAPASSADSAAGEEGAEQLAPSADWFSSTVSDAEEDAVRREFLSAELDRAAIGRNARETSNLRLLQTLPEQGISLYGYDSENRHGFGIVFYVSGTGKLYRIPIAYADNHDITPELYMGPDQLLYLIVHTRLGTGVSVSELYVFQPDHDMEWYRIDPDDLTDALNQAIRVQYDRRTERVSVYDSNGTLLRRAGISVIGALPDQVFTPDLYCCGAYQHYVVLEDGRITVRFYVSLIDDSNIGEGGLYGDHMLTAEVLLQFDGNGGVSGFTVDHPLPE